MKKFILLSRSKEGPLHVCMDGPEDTVTEFDSEEAAESIIASLDTIHPDEGEETMLDYQIVEIKI